MVSRDMLARRSLFSRTWIDSIGMRSNILEEWNPDTCTARYKESYAAIFDNINDARLAAGSWSENYATLNFSASAIIFELEVEDSVWQEFKDAAADKFSLERDCLWMQLSALWTKPPSVIEHRKGLTGKDISKKFLDRSELIQAEIVNRGESINHRTSSFYAVGCIGLPGKTYDLRPRWYERFLAYIIKLCKGKSAPCTQSDPLDTVEDGCGNVNGVGTAAPPHSFCGASSRESRAIAVGLASTSPSKLET